MVQVGEVVNCAPRCDAVRFARTPALNGILRLVFFCVCAFFFPSFEKMREKVKVFSISIVRKYFTFY